MSDCCNDFPISCAPKAPGGCNPCGPCKPPRPCPPPAVKPGTSMYIGARYVPIFADPVYWSNDRAFEPLTIVVKDGDCYTSKCYVPEGAPLPVRPENQNTYWVRTSDYNYQFEELRQAVVDLSKQVEKFAQDNEDFTAQMQAWNTTMQEWSGKIEDWGQTMDQFNTRVEAVENGLAEEIARAKAAETAEEAAREAADTALGSRITEEENRAQGEESAIRHEFAAADTALSNRITTNKADINAIKAEQIIQNNNISANAKNIQDNAAEIAKHAKRLTDLESNASDWDSVFPDTTIAQEVQKEENTRANAVTELKAKDTQLAADIEEVRDLANHKVDQTAFQAADNLNVKYGNAAHSVILSPSLLTAPVNDITRANVNKAYAITNNPTLQNANHYFRFPMSTLALKSEVDTAQAAADKANSNIGTWETDHPGQTVSECVTSMENELAATDAKADANTTNIGDWNTDHPDKTISQAVTDCLSYDKPGVVIPVAKNIPSIVTESVVLVWLNRPLKLSPADEAKTISPHIGISDPNTKEFHPVGPQTLHLYEFAATSETPVDTSFASTASVELASNYCVRLNPNVSDTGVVGLRQTNAGSSPYQLGFDVVKFTW